MGKSRFFTGQPIFSQLLSCISHNRVNRIAADHQADHYYKKFKTYEHLVIMLYGIFNRCTSLREVVTGFEAWEQRIVHLGIDTHPCRSTISDANMNRDASVFEKIYQDLYFKYRDFLPDSRTSKKARRLYIVDSSTVSLFQEILRNAGCRAADGRRKGGIKVHTLMRSDEDVPCLVRFTAAAASDSPFLKEIRLPVGSVLVMDRGYNNDYRQLQRLGKEGIIWISRMRNNAVYRVLEKKEVAVSQKEKGVLKDWIIELGHQHSKNNPRVKARLIEYRDPKSKEKYLFVSNGMRFAPFTISHFYRKRWQIELLFKRIKQTYPLRSFLGQSENAIKIQIWCALIADLTLKLIKAGAGRKWSFANLAAMVRLHLMTYINLNAFLENPERALRKKTKLVYQPSLFPT